MKVLISGASGLIGSALAPALEGKGHEVVALSRFPREAGHIHWDPREGQLSPRALEGFDAAVHLAGEPIGGRRWTEQHKARVLDSRVRGTTLLATTLASLDRAPAVLVSGSAVGYYGDRGDEVLTEASPSGEGFLAMVCRQWEQATEPAETAGVRVARVRTGLVLSERGGILPRQALPFRLGVGGRIGSGRQWASWISLTDEVRAIAFLLENDGLSGPFNLSAPNPVTNAEFTAALGGALRRPTLLPAPSFAVKAALGSEMAGELVLVSQRAIPEKLEKAGFRFENHQLESTLERLIGRRQGSS